MTKEAMESLIRLDDAVDRIAEGCYTLPSDDMPKYNIREIASEAERLGRPLTDDEAEKFVLGV
ncbi:hypothetical protein ACEE60_00575 [Streptococcus suis]|uniref:hypothetical protein n=1 Tax=Streptococcus suis TaxID=1307 RepID=UPI0005CD378C|nr:hypothetical protein [Streptococcus suis]MCQ8260958.1 hypothetical protein [Streptococcus suis]NQI41946.1 hypothetical protein [Streptococcus suis]CYU12432.1 Uncharacterised protein [Streptococcus suis]HEP1819242.1 hypothetical protein [Streptococcus suis]